MTHVFDVKVDSSNQTELNGIVLLLCSSHDLMYIKGDTVLNFHFRLALSFVLFDLVLPSSLLLRFINTFSKEEASLLVVVLLQPLLPPLRLSWLGKFSFLSTGH